LIHIIEAGYIAASRLHYKRIGESITLAWTACEQLISLLWIEMIEDAKNRVINPSLINKDRIKKLKGRDYPASVKIEMLQINGKISNDIYKLLTDARKSRNDWVHEMKIPDQRKVSSGFNALEKLLFETKNIEIHYNLTGRGGVPKWPIWNYEEIYNEQFLEYK